MSYPAFSFREFRREDAEAIMERMWKPGAAELDRLGMLDKNMMVEKFTNIADYGWTFFCGDEMVAICGAQRVDDTHYTWFMGTDDLWKVGREFTMWLRKFCKEMVEKEGVKLEMATATQHPNGPRWFAALGFEKYHEQGIFNLYRYTRKNKLTASAE
jgi:hypothetical protein